MRFGTEEPSKRFVAEVVVTRPTSQFGSTSRSEPEASAIIHSVSGQNLLEASRFRMKSANLHLAQMVLREARFHVRAGHLVESSAEVMPPGVPDRLFLVAAAGLPEFRPVYDALSRMSFYNLNPREIAAMQKADAGELLAREGWNSASVFAKLPESTKHEITDYLA